MSQKATIKNLSIKQIFFVCAIVFVCIVILGLGLGLDFGTGSRNDVPAQAEHREEQHRALPPGVTQVSAGDEHNFAIDSSGNLWAFGRNNYGQLGNMSIADRSTPINITAQADNPLNGRQITQVAAGTAGHTMAIDTQGNLWAFGYNNNGKLGNDSTTASSTPIEITAQVGNPLYGRQIVQVSAGNNHTMAIDSKGNLWAFGNNSNGQLGNKSTTGSTTPIEITAYSTGNPLYGRQIVQVSAGDYYTLAIDSEGNLWAWGDGTNGRLGNMATANINSTPINLTTQAGNPLDGIQITKVVAGGSHAIAIDSQGKLWTWGNGSNGKLGDMQTSDRSTPLDITKDVSGSPIANKQFVQASASYQHTMAVDGQGNLWVWGAGGYGRLGNMATANVNSTPINITAQSGNPLVNKQIIQASAGGSHSVIIDAGGSVWTFGNGSNGRLGNMATGQSSTPINITAQSGNPINQSQFGRMQVSAGGLRTMAIDDQGYLWAFGYGGKGQLGNMSLTTGNPRPINITTQSGNPLNGKQIIQVSAGYNHALAIDAQGNLWAFGNNDYGQLGNMSTTESSTPMNITAKAGSPLNGKQIIQVRAGYDHTLAIDSTGNLWAWGHNNYGQLGNMTTSEINHTPINLTAQTSNPLNGNKVVQVSAGYDHTLVIDAQGDLWAFGRGNYGQLGNMSTGQSSTPISITAQYYNPLYGEKIIQIATGRCHSMAIDSKGNLWAFGQGDSGQLGNYETTQITHTPVSITEQYGNPLNGKQIVQVSTSYHHTIAIDSQGNLWAFGSNENGQLGNMSIDDSDAPINITEQSDNPLNNKQIVQVTAGQGHTMAIDSQGNLWAFGGNSYGQLGNMSTYNSDTPINILIPPYASISATILGSPNARISARTNFTTGWGTTTASGGAYTGWTADSLTAPDIKINDDTLTGRVRYEFDANSIDTITKIVISSTTSMVLLSPFSDYNYAFADAVGGNLRTISADGGRRVIVEMDKINKVIITIEVTTTRKVLHNFSYSDNSHLSSRMKMDSGAETTSLSNIFTPDWSGNTGTVPSATFTFTSRVSFSKIVITRPNQSNVTITTFSGDLAAAAAGSGLSGLISISSYGGIETIIIQLYQMQQYEYTWTIETYQQIQVQQIYNPPAGATAIANPPLLTLNSSAGAGWANAALATPANQFGKTFAGWYTHPTGGSKISSIEQLQQQINSTGGAVVFLYAHWN